MLDNDKLVLPVFVTVITMFVLLCAFNAVRLVVSDDSHPVVYHTERVSNY